MTPWTKRERALHKALEAARESMQRIRKYEGGLIAGHTESVLCSAIDRIDSALADPPPPDPRDAALLLAEAELLRLWKLVPAGRAGVGGVRTIELEDDEVARLRQIVDAIRAANGGE